MRTQTRRGTAGYAFMKRVAGVVSIDAESNGLHGEVFAIGATWLDPSGDVRSNFVGRCPIREPVNTWVEANVLPALDSLIEADITAYQLRRRFWTWLTVPVNTPGVIVVADCGWPVEAGLLMACVNDSLAERQMRGPYPLHEVATLLLASGLDPTGDFAAGVMNETRSNAGDWYQPHHPLYDSEASGRVALRCLKKLGLV